LKSGFENIIVQPNSGSGAKQAQIKFQTAGGRSLSISRGELKLNSKLAQSHPLLKEMRVIIILILLWSIKRHQKVIKIM